MESSDLIAYGLIPEFIGRFPILVSLSALTENQLVQVKAIALLTISVCFVVYSFSIILCMHKCNIHISEYA